MRPQLCQVCGEEHRVDEPHFEVVAEVVERREERARHEAPELRASPAPVRRPVIHVPVGRSERGSSRHGIYADIDRRRAYRREWMRAWRARCGT